MTIPRGKAFIAKLRGAMRRSRWRSCALAVVVRSNGRDVAIPGAARWRNG